MASLRSGFLRELRGVGWLQELDHQGCLHRITNTSADITLPFRFKNITSNNHGLLLLTGLSRLAPLPSSSPTDRLPTSALSTAASNRHRSLATRTDDVDDRDTLRGKKDLNELGWAASSIHAATLSPSVIGLRSIHEARQPIRIMSGWLCSIHPTLSTQLFVPRLLAGALELSSYYCQRAFTPLKTIRSPS